MTRDLYQPWVARCTVEETKRSILRYLRGYEIDWEREFVSMPAWHFNGCAPPEEDNKVMTGPRVERALRELLTEGLIERKRRRVTHPYNYFLTAAGREDAPVREPIAASFPTEGTSDDEQ